MKHDLMRANQVLHRRHAGKYLLETMRALGMTDDEIRAALTPPTAASGEPARTPPTGSASEPVTGSAAAQAVDTRGDK